MKKLLTIIFSLLVCKAAYAGQAVSIDDGTVTTVTTVDTVSSVTASNPDPVTHSGQKSANVQIKGSAGTFYGFAGVATGASARVLIADDTTDTANAATILFDSGTATSGDPILFWLSEGVTADTGLYMDIDNASGVVYYE